MGNSCASSQKRTVMVPSRVIRVQVPEKELSDKVLRTNHSVNTAGVSTASHRPESLSRPGSRDNHPAFLDGEDEMKTTTTLRLFKYDLGELRIGEYYLEDEISEMIENLPEIKRKKVKKDMIKWDKVLVHQRDKVREASQEDSLYNYTDLCLREFAEHKAKSYNKMIQKNIPSRYRWSVWKNHLEIDKFYTRDLYEKLKGLSSRWEHDITKDLHRTFPNERYFASPKFDKIGQEHLFNVLKAVSLYLPNIGYAQSMNFIAAFLLLVSGGNELEAFWMFITLAKDHRFLMMGLFESGFPLLDFYTYVFYRVLEEELPEVYEHIKEQGIPDPLWLYKWFLTIFVYSFPPKYVIQVWDYIMVHGLFAAIKIAIGIVKFLQKDIMNVDCFGFDMLFKFLKGKTIVPKTILNLQDHEPETHTNMPPLMKKGTNIVNHNMGSMNDIDKSSFNHGHNETSQIQYSFEEFDIQEILEHADKVPLTLEKISEYTNDYTKDTQKTLPEVYEKFFKEWHTIKHNPAKLNEFQKELDFHIMKLGLYTELVRDNTKKIAEVLVSIIEDDEDDIDVLKVTHFN